MNLLKLYKIGEQILQQRAAVIENFNTQELLELVENLFLMMRQNNGVGLAAPQIGYSKRIFVYGFDKNPRYPDKAAIEDTVIINPEVLSASTETNDDYEGCLSVPGLRGLVPRPNIVTFRSYTVDGQPFEKTIEGFEARIFCHELDHLDGMHFLERVMPKSIRYVEPVSP